MPPSAVLEGVTGGVTPPAIQVASRQSRTPGSGTGKVVGIGRCTAPGKSAATAAGTGAGTAGHSGS